MSFLISFFLCAELSEVLWNMVLHIGLKFTGVLGVVACFVLFTYWAGEWFILPEYYKLTIYCSQLNLSAVRLSQ